MEQDSRGGGGGPLGQAANGFAPRWLPPIPSTFAWSPHEPQAGKEANGEGSMPLPHEEKRWRGAAGSRLGERALLTAGVGQEAARAGALTGLAVKEE